MKDGLKTQLLRKFPINDQLHELLVSIKPSEYNPKSLVFPNRVGKFLDWSDFTNRAWKRVLSSFPDIKYRNPYQTGHTFCSVCRKANIPSIQVAKWVGNSAQMIDKVGSVTKSVFKR